MTALTPRPGLLVVTRPIRAAEPPTVPLALDAVSLASDEILGSSGEERDYSTELKALYPEQLRSRRTLSSGRM